MYTKEEVMEFVNEEDVKFVRLTFFDFHGKQKNVSITTNQLEKAFNNEISFDASSIFGFEKPEKSDLFLSPDPSTLAIIPWRPNSGKVVRMFCNIENPDGTPYIKDCRSKLQKAIKAMKEEFNCELKIGSEIEFYLFRLDEKGCPTLEPFDHAGYMDIAPEDKGENIRREICFTLEQMGIIPEASHHEAGPGQNEIDFHYSDVLSAADHTETFKWIVRTKAAANGLYADFSPKPLKNEAGSGMHINLSCSDPSKLDNILAGILKHAKELTYFLNNSEESYNRLSEFKAPKYICWGPENRTAFIRIPATKGNKRLELRAGDPECNPYLVFTLLIYAAMDGIRNNMVPPSPILTNTYFDENCIDLELIPDTYDYAKQIASESEFIKEILEK